MNSSSHEKIDIFREDNVVFKVDRVAPPCSVTFVRGYYRHVFDARNAFSDDR